MNAPVDDSTRMARMAGDVVALEAVGEAWPIEQRAALKNLREAIEALHREALLRLVRGLREDPAAAASLKALARDPFIFGVLRLHGIVRDPLETRVRAALDAVAPMLAEHGGGVELVAVKPPDTVEIRLTGNCQHCPASGQTLAEGVERSIREHAPEIVHVRHARHASQAPGEAVAMHFVSPFARKGDSGYLPVCQLDELPPGRPVARVFGDRALLLLRTEGGVHCVDNACAHLGMPLHEGHVTEDVVLACPHHGFRYRLDTGECLDIPEVQLVVHGVQVRGGTVSVKVDA